MKRCLGCMEQYDSEYDICPHCGYVEGTVAEEAIHIEPGTFLAERYIIGKVLGFGGFGVTYIGWDTKLEQKVAIKEYLPSEFSTRMPGQLSVTIFSGEKQEQFQDGLNKFVEEAKRLSKFQNESGIVKVFDSFIENCTAYIIMEYLDGETLTSRLNRDGSIPEDEAVSMLLPVMNSLQTVHQEGILHRDIAPDNIFLTKDGEVKLIDFGASRYATTSHSRSLTVIIKPGYSPEEQYRSRGDQGPHTDVYAMAATLYKAITGITPPDALERRASIETKKKDLITNPRKISRKISPIYENALLNAMNVQIEDRTPDMIGFMEELSSETPVARRYGKIRKIDFFTWPLWLKILLPLMLSVFLVFGAMLATGIINFPSLFSDEVVVPDGIVVVPNVEGMDKDDAIQLLENSKLTPLPDGNVTSEYIEAGKIILQSPSEGAYIEEQGVISLTVSSGVGVVEVENGISTVPYVVWDTQENAVKKLKQAGLAEPMIETKVDENVPAGSVISQSVEAGTKVDEGTQITIIVSTGPASFEMPNVVGKTAKTAESTLKSKGLIVTVQYEKNNDVAEGTVLSQSTKPGASVKKGDTVTITVSSGKKTVAVASVVGKTKSAAVAALEDQKLSVSVIENYSETVASGKVISQSPAAGTTQVVGTTVTIYVSKGKQPITVPNVVGKTRSAASSTLSQSGFVVSVVEQYSSSVASGNVISQSPSSGTTKYAGDTITIYVSKGTETIYETGVSLNKTSKTLDIGETVTLYATVSPSNASNTSVTWSSSDTSIATVSGGKVTAIKPGTATITVKTALSGKTATCSIIVSEIDVPNIDDVTLNMGSSKTYSVGTVSTQGVSSSVEWSSSNKNVATVSSGKVTALSPGTATITLKITVNGISATETFKVTVPTPTVSLSSYSGSGKQSTDAQKYSTSSTGAIGGIDNLSTSLYGWRVSLPTATLSNYNGVSVSSWVVVSGNAATVGNYLYISKPGTVTVKCWYVLEDGTEVSSSSYTYTLSLYKTTSASNNIRSGPGTSYSKVGSVPGNTSVTVTDIYYTGAIGVSGTRCWGKVTYNGVTGWITLFYW